MTRIHQYVAEYLQARGVGTVFELIGGMITFLIDSLHTKSSIRVVSVHHEQAAAFAADAIGRITGIPGVALATSGPGATNLLTGIGSCYFDSSPAVFITGQVNSYELKGTRGIRQQGFQETDIVSMARPITKAAWQATRPGEVPQLLERAFELAVAGRPGPVLLDLPMDIQRGEVDGSPELTEQQATARLTDPGALDELMLALQRAERPIVLLGGGVSASGTAAQARELIEAARLPTVFSLMGVDVLPYDHPLRVGFIGSYGNRWANVALGRSDLILVLGSRLDIRQTGSDTDFFQVNRTIYHVDCEAAEVNNRVKGCRALICELPEFFQALHQRSIAAFPDRLSWREEIAELRRIWPDTAELSNVEGVNPNAFLHRLSRASGSAAAFLADVGQHQMWSAQSLELQPGQRFLTSGGMGSMGFGLPASIGACLATATPRPVVVVSGDGGFQCNIQELETVAHHGLPIKMVIVNNGCHGMVRQFQESYFNARYHATLWGYSAPDFAKVANAYGIPARTVEDEAGIADGIAFLWQEPHAPALLHVKVNTFANAYPKIAFGHPLTEMEPFVRPLEMEGT